MNRHTLRVDRTARVSAHATSFGDELRLTLDVSVRSVDRFV